MSTTANIINGEIVNNGTSYTSSTSSITKAITASEKESGGTLDKEAFLKLLVAQMQYQDPLEPTDNTEYISQLATFSSLEEMQNMSTTMDRQSASGLVGQYVYLETTDSATGATKTIEGAVDYVSFSGNKTYLSVNGTLYDYEDLVSVADADFILAGKLADTFSSELGKLKNLNMLTEEDLDSVGAIVEAYSNMTSYQKSFLTDDELKTYGQYAEWYANKLKEIDDSKSGAGDDSKPEAEEAKKDEEVGEN